MPLNLRPQRALAAVRSLPHRDYDRAQLLLFAGRRGQGKTTALVSYLETREPRVLALDPFEDLKHIRMRTSLTEALDELAEGKACRRRVVPPIDASSKDYAEALFEELARRQLGDLLLVLDEVTLWTNIHASGALQTLILQGRRLGIRLAVCCQRIALVPGVMLAEMTELVVFNMTRPRDLEVLAEWSDRETAEMASKLGVGDCLVIVP